MAGPLAAESQKSGHVSSASILSHSGVGLAKGDKTKKLKCFKSIMQTCPKLEIEDSVSLSATKREREGAIGGQINQNKRTENLKKGGFSNKIEWLKYSRLNELVFNLE